MCLKLYYKKSRNLVLFFYVNNIKVQNSHLNVTQDLNTKKTIKRCGGRFWRKIIKNIFKLLQFDCS